MKRIHIDDIKKLAQHMVSRIDDNCYVVAVLFFNEAKELMRELLNEYELDIGCINITNEEYDGYEGEYYVSLTDDGFLSIEPAWREGIYLKTDADLILIDGYASHTIVERNIGSEFVEICFCSNNHEECFEDDCCCDCCDCHEDDTVHELNCDCNKYEITNDDNPHVINVRLHVDDLLNRLFGI